MDAATQRAMDALSLMVLESGRRWGETAVQYQRENAEAILNQDSAIRQHWVELPRGARKTTDLAAILLVVLLFQAPPMARVFVGASDEDQAAELIDAARGLITRTPELAGRFKINELEVINVANGSSVTALAADGSAMGKRAFLVVLDEVANWPNTRKHKRFWTALISGNRKLAECRTVVISNAGDPESWVWKHREVARTSEHWRFARIDGPLPWLTPADLQILRENSVMESEYSRLHLNQWVVSEDMLATPENIAACVVLPGPLPPRPGVRYICALDVGTVNDPTVVAVMHAERDDFGGRKVVLDQIRRWHGTKKLPVNLQNVADTLTELSQRYNHAQVIADPHEAIMVLQQLRTRGVGAEEFPFTSTSVGRLALVLHQAIEQHRIELPDDAALIEELKSVRLVRNSLGVFRLEHDPGNHNDQAVVLALGAHHLMGQNSAATFHMGPLSVDPVFDPFAVGNPGQMRPRTVAGFPTLTSAGQVPGWDQYGGFPWAA